MDKGFVDVFRMFWAQLAGFALGILGMMLKAHPEKCLDTMPWPPSRPTRSFHATPISFLSHFFTQAESLHHRHKT
jgi:hypothetical protein